MLRSNAAITRLLIRLFESRFDPQRQGGADERCEAITEELRGQLEEVVSLDHDRILRTYLALVESTLRTNYYRTDSPGGADGPGYLVIKLDPGSVPGLMSPRPKFEIFVYSPRLEGVHLRFGRVARGGLRWSERLEDFRTEVLGLVKAQEVKNAVIVPSGSKGGFICKQLRRPLGPRGLSGRSARLLPDVHRGVLDVTDNLVGGKVVPPPDVVRHDGDDPYLVVAADKGTATFSDIANGDRARVRLLAGRRLRIRRFRGLRPQEDGHHRARRLGIGQAPLRELRHESSTTDFTVVGVGDMSGDVFGNGMLLSRHIKLVAAFDHRHIFLDPDPDPAASFAERSACSRCRARRGRTMTPTLISEGGGVWPRSAKSVPISPQARAALGIGGDRALAGRADLGILAAPVDLLWNGGIGTYVKAVDESHADVGDRANDAVRVNATQLRAKVVAEGGNLGPTQAAASSSRSVAAACTPIHRQLRRRGQIGPRGQHQDPARRRDPRRRDSRSGRHQLLHEMTEEVASLVLRHNYSQNMALAVSRAQAPSLLHVHTRYLRKLVKDNRLQPEQDVLPDDRDIAERRSAGRGLTNPEFALLLTHTKIAATRDVLASGLPDDRYLRRVLVDYFPAPLRARFADRMQTHRLRREIITTSIVNEMVDTSGTTFVFRLSEETGASVPDITRAWLVAREVFDMAAFWQQVTELDGKVDLNTQITLLLEGRKLTERAVRWLLHYRRPPFDIEATVGFFAAGVRTVRAGLPKLLTGTDLSGFNERRDSYLARGVGRDLAELVAAMVPTYAAFDIVQTAVSAGRDIEETAEVYFDLADQLQITRVRDRITALPREDRWSTMARAALRDDLYAAHASLTGDVLGVGGSGTPTERLGVWQERNQAAVSRAGQTLSEIWESDRFTFTTLSVALRAIRTLAGASSLPHS